MKAKKVIALVMCAAMVAGMSASRSELLVSMLKLLLSCSKHCLLYSTAGPEKRAL